MQKTDTQFLQADSWSQEPITRSLHLPYILESTFARIFLFLEQFSPQASLNSQESILYTAVYCAVFCWVVFCCVVLYYIVLYHGLLTV